MSSFQFRPGSFIGLPLDELSKELDTHLPRLYDAHNVLRGICVQGPALNAGYATVAGTVTFTGSKLSISTGLATVKQVTATIATAVATNINVTAIVTPAIAGAINLYAWQPTSSSVTTAIAATTPVTVHWTASGINTLNTVPTS